MYALNIIFIAVLLSWEKNIGISNQLKKYAGDLGYVSWRRPPKDVFWT